MDIEQLRKDLALISDLIEGYDHLGTGSSSKMADQERVRADAAMARINATIHNSIVVSKHDYKCGENYEMGLWSRRNIEAFLEDQNEQQ